MADINIKGRYRMYTHDGTIPFDFTTYANNLCVIRRPNENTFVTVRQYVPGPGAKPFTTFEPGSSYTISTKTNDSVFSMGPYTRSDRLPSSTTIKSPIFYIGLDRNSIPVPLSSYTLGANSPLSTIRTTEANLNGFYTNFTTFDANSYKIGFNQGFTHLQPGSSYELRNRVPFTLFAPLQSEMGDAFAIGQNDSGEFGMGHRYSPYNPSDNRFYFSQPIVAEQIFGIWDKIVNQNTNSKDEIIWENQTFSSGSFAALSSCGLNKVIFVRGSNLNGKLGTGSTQQYYPTWTRINGLWRDVDLGWQHMVAIDSQGYLFSCGLNSSGQLGLGSGVASTNTLTLVDNSRTYVELAITSNSTLVRDSQGRIWGCGNNSYGQLGLNNQTSPIYSLTQESTNSSWTKVKAIAGASAVGALKDKKIFVTGANTHYFGSGTTGIKTIFTQESLGLSEIEDFLITGSGSLIRRTGQSNLFSSGNNGSTGRIASLSGTTMVYYNKTNIPNNVSKLITDNYSVIGYIIGNDFYGRTSTSSVSKVPTWTIQSQKIFDVYPEVSYQNTVFLLSSANYFRPTPSPTVTPSPTPSPVPFTPYNNIEISIFGSSFQINTSSTSNQNRVFSTPGNLSNDFTRESMNENLIPPGNSYLATFDYEKTTTYNNIVGVSIIMNYNQNPSGREYCRYLFRKTGSSWTYSLLPSQFDALSDPNSTLDYRGSETGTDTIFITPPNPQYANTSQGLYSLMFMRDEAFYEAISYNRGVDWNIYSFISLNSESQFDSYGLKNKIFYSRTRESNYKVRAVGYTGSSPMGGFSDNSLYFSERFPNFTSPELIYDFGSRYAWGFDFKHDYFNIPTVVSVGATQSSFGIYLHRKINNTWQTSIIKDNITNLCYGPYYQVPTSSSFYKRINSPVVSVEFDSTNPNLIYIAYLKHTIYFPTAYNDPAFIGVLCYNMQTNSIVFDEVPVSAKYETGALTKTDSQYIDIPTLYFDTSNNTLNLFFSGPIYTQNPVDVFYRYYQTRRSGNNSWITPNYLFTDSSRSGSPDGTYITNSWELRTKY